MACLRYMLRHGLAHYAADKPGLQALRRSERRRLYRLDHDIQAMARHANARTRDRGATVSERLAWAEMVAGWDQAPQCCTDEQNGADR